MMRPQRQAEPKRAGTPRKKPKPANERTPSALSQQFAALFRDEHREARDILFGLIESFQSGEYRSMRPLLARLRQIAGPHFCYEEQALYPTLLSHDLIHDAYFNHLMNEHDRGVAVIRKLVQVADHWELSEDDRRIAAMYAYCILPHVTECDGLSLLVERLPDKQIKAILERRERARREVTDLLDWAAGPRDRPLRAASTRMLWQH